MAQRMPEYSELPERSQVVHQHLRAAGLTPSIHELPDSTRTAREAASALGCDVGAIASSLIFLADGEPLLVMTSGRHRVDTDILASTLGVSSMAMAPAARVRDVTGQAIGGVAPVGHPTPVRTVVDESLRDYANDLGGGRNTAHGLCPDLRRTHHADERHSGRRGRGVTQVSEPDRSGYRTWRKSSQSDHGSIDPTVSNCSCAQGSSPRRRRISSSLSASTTCKV